MSTVTPSSAPTMAPIGERRPITTTSLGRFLAVRRNTILTVGGILLALMSITRLWTGEHPLTSSGTIGTALRLTVPIMLAGLAALWAERCGVLNIGIEGMMILGTWGAGFGAWKWGAWVGLGLGILGGMLGGLIHAVATVRFNVDQVISGVVLNIFGFFGARYLSDLIFVGEQGGGVSQSPQQKSGIPKFDTPFLAGGDLFGWKSPDFFGWLEKKRWFLVGDIGGIGKGLTVNLSWLTVLAVLMVPLTFWIMWRTRFGLRLRSSGEAPSAAESLGVKVIPLRYAGLLISGALAGFGGATLAIVASSYYRQGQTGGRGFIGMAAMIFGNWRPLGIAGGAAVFGYSDGVKLVASSSLPALFLFVTLVAGLMVIVSLVRKRTITVITAFVTGALFFTAYLTVKEVPESLTQSVPYVATLVVLATASKRLRPPAQAGVKYRPGEGH
ncbi:MAG: ABC transporter permease [Actinomycetia bacterium]|nr:ABC transporter permease [Actinomycetes bacterium]